MRAGGEQLGLPWALRSLGRAAVEPGGWHPRGTVVLQPPACLGSP